MMRVLPADRALRTTLIFALGFVFALVVLSNLGYFLMYSPLLGIGISAAYFFASPKGESFERRLATSAHGLSITALYFAFMTWSLFFPWPIQGEPNWPVPNAPMIEETFNFMCFLPLALIVVSLIFFRGQKILHLLQLWNLILVALTSVVGNFSIIGPTL